MKAKRKRIAKTNRALSAQLCKIVASTASEWERRRALGERLRWTRLALGYARWAFAEALGTDASTLAAQESGELEIDAEQLETIVETFGVDGKWLTTGIGRPYPDLVSAASNFLLVPKAPFLAEEREGRAEALDAIRLGKAVAALEPEQRARALRFYSRVVAALAGFDS